MKKTLLISIGICLTIYACISAKQPGATGSRVKAEQIMFTSKRDGNFEVYVMHGDSTNVRRLTDHPKTDYGQSWSPDGQYILFYSDRDGNEELYRMKNDGSEVIRLTNTSSNERNACYAPDGKTIVFASDRDNKTDDLYRMKADGSAVQRLTENRVYCESPAFTPDGKHIVFTRQVQKDTADKNFNGELFIMDADGKNQRRLTHKDGFDSGAAISPNGQQIAFYGRSEKGFVDIFIMNRDGSGMINITADELEDYSPAWSPDGNWLAYTSGNSKNYDIWKIHVRNKQKIRLTSQPKRDETPYYQPGGD